MMLRIAQDVDSFLSLKSMCARDHDTPADFLVLCTYSYAPHTTAFCKHCIQKLEYICECGSGAQASGIISSIMDKQGNECCFTQFEQNGMSVSKN